MKTERTSSASTSPTFDPGTIRFTNPAFPQKSAAATRSGLRASIPRRMTKTTTNRARRKSSPDWTSWTPYTYPFNLTQQPALSVPCGFTSAGLPIGLQVVGPRHADALVLRVGQAYQSATDWHLRTPALLTEEVR